MSDFSLYVFHPYGAGKQKSAVTGLPPGSGPLGMKQEEPKLVVIFKCAYNKGVLIMNSIGWDMGENNDFSYLLCRLLFLNACKF